MIACDSCHCEIESAFKLEPLYAYFHDYGLKGVCEKCFSIANESSIEGKIDIRKFGWRCAALRLTGKNACDSCGGSGLVTVLLKPGSFLRAAVTRIAPCGECMLAHQAAAKLESK